MRKRVRILLAVAIAALLGGTLLWGLFSRSPLPPDPVYGGHPLSAWLIGGGKEFGDLTELIDSNAVPYLTCVLTQRDGLLRKGYNRIWTKSPAWFQHRLPAPTITVGAPVRGVNAVARYHACKLLDKLGKAARPAIPELIRVLKTDDEPDIRYEAAVTLGNLANAQDKTAIAALVAAMRDENSSVSFIAARTLANLDPNTAIKAGVIIQTNGDLHHIEPPPRTP